MNDWRSLLSRLAAVPGGGDELALVAYRAEPPTGGAAWPFELPAPCPAIADFYARCDGGTIGEYLWPPPAGLPELNRQWRFFLSGYYGAGGDPLDPARHLVLAEESGGAPLVWDADVDRMATFWPDGGDWEPTGLAAEEFFAALFTPPEDPNDLWGRVLRLLDAGGTIAP